MRLSTKDVIIDYIIAFDPFYTYNELKRMTFNQLARIANRISRG